MKPGKRQGLTTGEAARALGVSVPTVIRYFNKGILTGWKNPITGRMVIDLESVTALWRRSQGLSCHRRSKWRKT